MANTRTEKKLKWKAVDIINLDSQVYLLHCNAGDPVNFIVLILPVESYPPA